MKSEYPLHCFSLADLIIFLRNSKCYRFLMYLFGEFLLIYQHLYVCMQALIYTYAYITYELTIGMTVLNWY